MKELEKKEEVDSANKSNNDDSPGKEDKKEKLWERFIYILNHREVSETLKLIRQVVNHERKWSHIIESFITLIVAGLLIWILIWLVDQSYLEKGAFGVMFGTVFGYLLSWRFGKQ